MAHYAADAIGAEQNTESNPALVVVDDEACHESTMMNLGSSLSEEPQQTLPTGEAQQLPPPTKPGLQQPLLLAQPEQSLQQHSVIVTSSSAMNLMWGTSTHTPRYSTTTTTTGVMLVDGSAAPLTPLHPLGAEPASAAPSSETTLLAPLHVQGADVTCHEPTPPPQDLSRRSKDVVQSACGSSGTTISLSVTHQTPSSPLTADLVTSVFDLEKRPSSAPPNSGQCLVPYSTPPPSRLTLSSSLTTSHDDVGSPLPSPSQTTNLMTSSSTRNMTAPDSMMTTSVAAPSSPPTSPAMESPVFHDNRSNTPFSSSKRDDVLKRLKQENRWSEDEEDEEEEAEEMEEESQEDDDIIPLDDIMPLDFDMKVEQFYRDILHSNPDCNDAMIENTSSGSGNKTISKTAPKFAQKQQPMTSNVVQSFKSIPSPSKVVPHQTVALKKLPQKVIPNRFSPQKPSPQKSISGKSIPHKTISHSGMPPFTRTQPHDPAVVSLTDGATSFNQSVVMAAAHQDTAMVAYSSSGAAAFINANYYSNALLAASESHQASRMPDVIVTGELPASDNGQQSVQPPPALDPPPPQLLTTLSHVTSGVQQHAISCAEKQIYSNYVPGPSPPPLAQPTLDSHSQQPQPLTSPALLSTLAGGGAAMDPIAAASQAGPVVLLTLADLKKLPRLLGKLRSSIFGQEKRRTKLVNAQTQTRKHRVKNEVRDTEDEDGEEEVVLPRDDEQEDMVEPDDDDSDDDDVQWVGSSSDDEASTRHQKPTTTLTNIRRSRSKSGPKPRSSRHSSPSPSPSPSRGDSMPRAVKEIEKKSLYPIYSNYKSKKTIVASPVSSSSDKQVGSEMSTTGKHHATKNPGRRKNGDDSSRERDSSEESRFQVLQSKVYIVGQGREEKAFVQNLEEPSDSHRSSDYTEAAEESEEEEGDVGPKEATGEESEEEEGIPATSSSPSKNNVGEESPKKKKKKTTLEKTKKERSPSEDSGSESVRMVSGEEGNEEVEGEDGNSVANAEDTPSESFGGKKKNKNNMYQCRYCPKEYTHAGTRRIHERKHTGEVPYSCPSCGRGFGSLSNYKRHLKLCRGGNDLQILPSFKCEACGQEFRKEGSLSTHYRFKHERPELECEECGWKFPAPTYLERHKAKCHGTGTKAKKTKFPRVERNLYYCQCCGWNSRTKKALAAHMKKMHELGGDDDEDGTGKKKRKRKKSRKTEESVDEKPIVIDLANAKWMTK